MAYIIKNLNESTLDKLKEQYRDLFSGKTGKLNGFQAKMYVKEDATPKFCAPREVPFAMQEAVTMELQRLENEDIILEIAAILRILLTSLSKQNNTRCPIQTNCSKKCMGVKPFRNWTYKLLIFRWNWTNRVKNIL